MLNREGPRSVVGAVVVGIAVCCCALAIAGCAKSSSSASPATTTTTSKPFDAKVFCAAVGALADGPVAADHDVAAAHARVNALGASIPGYLSKEIPQIMSEYNAVIDAYAANGFDTAAVLANADDQVKATVARLAREAQGEELEPEAALGFEASHVCPLDTASSFSSVGTAVN